MPGDDTPKKKKKGKFLKILILLILLGGVGGAVYFLAWPTIQGMLLSDDAPATAPATTQTQAQAVPGPSNVVPLPTFMVNLADPLGRRYIKLTVEVEVSSEQAAIELQNNSAKVRDSINLLLSSKSYADLAPAESKVLLKNEIVERLNQILGGPKVARVYFVDIVIQ